MLCRVTTVRLGSQHVDLSNGHACTGALIAKLGVRFVSTTRKRRSIASNASLAFSNPQTPALLYSGLVPSALPPASKHCTKKPLPNPPSLASPASLIVPKPRSIHHNSLLTYLTHVRRTNASQTSTTYLGTRYEYLVLQHLESVLNFQLTRVGGRGDKGIDLIGTWRLPSLPLQHSQAGQKRKKRTQDAADGENEEGQRVPVVIQTKRLSPSSTTTSAPLPAYLRALEGTLTLGSTYSFSEDTLGILICTRPATEGLRKAMAASRRGLMYMCIEEIAATSADGNGEGEGIPGTRIVQILWNQAATDIALEGFSVGTSYDLDGTSDQAQLLWQGRPVQFTKNNENLSG